LSSAGFALVNFALFTALALFCDAAGERELDHHRLRREQAAHLDVNVAVVAGQLPADEANAQLVGLELSATECRLAWELVADMLGSRECCQPEHRRGREFRVDARCGGVSERLHRPAGNSADRRRRHVMAGVGLARNDCRDARKSDGRCSDDERAPTKHLNSMMALRWPGGKVGRFLETVIRSRIEYRSRRGLALASETPLSRLAT
jgi:hypothetical protein